MEPGRNGDGDTASRSTGRLMADATFALRLVAIGVPCCASAAVGRQRKPARSALQVVGGGGSERASPARCAARESLDEALMVLFSCLTARATSCCAAHAARRCAASSFSWDPRCWRTLRKPAGFAGGLVLSTVPFSAVMVRTRTWRPGRACCCRAWPGVGDRSIAVRPRDLGGTAQGQSREGWRSSDCRWLP